MCSLARFWAASIACAALGLGGCSAPPERSRPQIPPNPDPHIQRAASGLDAAAVDPEFDAAVLAFSNDVRTLGRGVEDVEIRKSLRLLAVALEQVPHADGVEVERTSAVIRGTRERSLRGHDVIAMPDDAAPLYATDRALSAVAQTFVGLARGPYRDAPGLLERAYAVDAAARDATRAGTEGTCRARAVVALRRAEIALLALRQANARGQVRPEAAVPMVSWSE